MMRLRISLAGMMGLLLALALSFYTVRFPSEGAAAAVLLVTQAILAFAVLAVVYRTRDRRAFWLGFAGRSAQAHTRAVAQAARLDLPRQGRPAEVRQRARSME